MKLHRRNLLAAAVAFGVCGSAFAALAQQQRPPAPVEACAPCHGADGIARDVEVPHLAGQNVVYLYNQLRAFRSGQRKHKEMQYMSRALTQEEMEALAQYFASLPRS
jgi:cytochrome c553